LDNNKNLTSNDTKNDDCPVYYRFKFQNNKMELISYEEVHSNHSFKIKKDNLNDDMIKDISCFNKNTSVTEIREFLERKYKVELSYSLVYFHFRKIFPMFGPDDASTFIKFCEDNEFDVEKCIDESDKSITKLFICSKLMKAHYKAYGDSLIVDATYRVNKYKLPVVIFSGYTHKGRNCIFGIGIVNDEKESTYNWLFAKFFASHTSLPIFLVSDHDLSIKATLEKSYKTITHLLCLWHIIQSFSKYFNFLHAMNHGALKTKILELPYIENQDEFQKTYELIQKSLTEKKFLKGSHYLEEMWKIREKWARAYLPWRFTGGTRTTSRAEAINSLIKQYVSSKNEVSDIINFISSFEKNQFMIISK